jgi:heptosyltransferase-1
MGDILHTLPAVASLKHGLAGSSITWAVEPRWAPLLEDNPFIEDIIIVDRRSARALLALWRRLRDGAFDTAVDFQGLMKSALVASFAHPEQIVGLHRSAAREPLAALLYSSTCEPRAEHVVDRQLEIAACAGATAVVRTFALPEGRPEGVLPDGPFVLASPLAGWAGKQWPLEYYAKLAAMFRASGYSLVLNGPHTIEVPGALPHASGLAGLIWATRRAAAVVGIDSGPLHLAAALCKPGVAIFGPTDPARNGPYGGSIRVLRARGARTTYKRHDEIDPSMRAVTPEEVWAALRPQLTL